MRILVTFALEQEFAPWRSVRSFRQVLDGGSARGYVARSSDAEVCVLFTGIGPANAYKHLSKGRVDERFDCVISSGLAGSLASGYAVGDIVAAEKVGAADDNQCVPSDSRLLQIARDCGAKVGRFCTSNRVASTAAEKRRLAANADVVEMESLVVLNDAGARGFLAVAIRAVSDAVETDLPLDFSRIIGEQGTLRIAETVGEIVKHPGALPGLIRFGKESRRAAANLAHFLERYVQDVAVLMAGANSQQQPAGIR